MNKEAMRHGDVILQPISQDEANQLKEKATKIKRENGYLTLAEGEVTGHHHSFSNKGAELWQLDETSKLLELSEVSSLSHQEHKTINVEPGCYRVIQKRQYTPNGWETVAD